MRLLLDNRDQLLDALVQELRQLKNVLLLRAARDWWKAATISWQNGLPANAPMPSCSAAELSDALPPDSRILIQNDGQVKVISPQLMGRLHLNEPTESG